jgi:soluble lytic murein transglycosylase
MKFLQPAAILSICLFSCSSQSKISKETDLFVDYVKAMNEQEKNPAEACVLFSELSKNESFILKDVAYVRAAKNCTAEPKLVDWSRPVPAWLDTEKKTLFFTTLEDNLQKGLFVKDNTSLFRTPERISYYQKALASKDINKEDKIALETALYSLSPRFMDKPAESDYLKIAKDYRSVRLFSRAYEYLNRIINSSKFSKEEKMIALKESFYTHKLNRLQDKKAYIASAKKWAQYLKEKDLKQTQLLPLYYEAQVNMIRVLWTENGSTEALKALAQLEKSLTKKYSLFDVYWLRGRIYEELKRRDDSQKQLEKAAAEETPNWREKEKILWSLAWSRFKSKDFKRAIEHLDLMIASPDVSPYARYKYQYWKGEALQRQSLETEAKAVWGSLAIDDPYGYYGLLAHHQLDKPLLKFTISDFNSRVVLSPSELDIFNALVKVDELDFAQKLLSEKLSSKTELVKKSADDISAIFQKLALVNSYNTIFYYFTQLSPEVQKEVFLKVPQVLFPNPYSDLVTSAAKDAGIEPELVYSIMRQESSFNPMARSPMDAFGLLQLLPEVARRVAKTHKIPFTGYEDLYKPEINIPLGSYLLKTQNKAFDNKFVLMVASYNASSSAVRNWYKRYDGDDLMFIEDIPYEETKTYVKLITRNLVLYKKLIYGDEFRAFPRHILEL